jgi:AraC family transcriptional regulator
MPTVRESTLMHRRVGIQRAIDLMRTDLSVPLRLADLAKAAGMSEYHYTRIFHESTGLSPLRFLAALRLAKARDMLVSTDDRIVEIGLEVGYSSIGTFTRRFTELVGVSPMRLRQYSRAHALPTSTIRRTAGAAICVRLLWPEEPRRASVGPALVAAFASPLPFGVPVACAIAKPGNALSLTGLGVGRYYLFAFTSLDQISFSASPVSLTIDDVAEQPGDIAILLRRFELTDPPLLSFVPFILQRIANITPVTHMCDHT